MLLPVVLVLLIRLCYRCEFLQESQSMSASQEWTKCFTGAWPLQLSCKRFWQESLSFPNPPEDFSCLLLHLVPADSWNGCVFYKPFHRLSKQFRGILYLWHAACSCWNSQSMLKAISGCARSGYIMNYPNSLEHHKINVWTRCILYFASCSHLQRWVCQVPNGRTGDNILCAVLALVKVSSGNCFLHGLFDPFYKWAVAFSCPIDLSHDRSFGHGISSIRWPCKYNLKQESMQERLWFLFLGVCFEVFYL